MATAIKDQRTIPAMDTLVKYDNPVLITTRPEKVRKDSALAKVGIAACKIQTTSASADTRRETIEILNRILPPKEWEEDGQIWTQRVSSTPATRLDVINLQEQLDMRLQQRQARETGICPVRRQLYAQCFDELIRQVTVSCAERGLLLLRAEQGKENLINTAEELRLQKIDLEKTVAELRLKYDQSEKRSAELREAEEKKHMEEVQFLKKTNLQLKTQLEGIITSKK
ncbi:putative inner dynein arm light chain, axonemal Dnali1 isoform X2 [Temnothorax americanus]|uniref:putative inner dynein arm light chain, axonemal Dnali1 isoform X2 n=1 Tax=Temnothorax americanus TaxID=1964332 RepID=UPI0040689596